MSLRQDKQSQQARRKRPKAANHENLQARRNMKQGLQPVPPH